MLWFVAIDSNKNIFPSYNMLHLHLQKADLPPLRPLANTVQKLLPIDILQMTVRGLIAMKFLARLGFGWSDMGACFRFDVVPSQFYTKPIGKEAIYFLITDEVADFLLFETSFYDLHQRNAL